MDFYVHHEFDWVHLKSIDLKKFKDLKNQIYLASQLVSNMGRVFKPYSQTDEYAHLYWIAGLKRIVSIWVQGKELFRTSLSISEFNIFLVNEKINILASISINNKNYKNILIDLEKEVISLNLASSHLTLKLPYKIENEYFEKSLNFNLANEELCLEFEHYFQNAYYIFSKIYKKSKIYSDIYIHPKLFHYLFHITLKETGKTISNSCLTVGFSFGDKYFDEPYFYITSFPYVIQSKDNTLTSKYLWYENDWAGFVLKISDIWNVNNQEEYILSFINDSIKYFKSHFKV